MGHQYVEDEQAETLVLAKVSQQLDDLKSMLVVSDDPADAKMRPLASCVKLVKLKFM